MVFVQLGSFAYVMVSFKANVAYTAELVSKYACKYDLSNEDIDVLMATVNKDHQVKSQVTITSEVQRGVPEWLQELETAANAIVKRVPPKQLSDPEEEAKEE